MNERNALPHENFHYAHQLVVTGAEARTQEGGLKESLLTKSAI